MELTPLTAISPLDGRYANKTTDLRSLFSEMGLMQLRLHVEIAWLKFLSATPEIHEVPPFSQQAIQFLDEIVNNFSLDDARKIKNIEATINHDVKAVEYYLKESLEAHPELAPVTEFVHFACTSDDINNLAYALQLQKARQEILLPRLANLSNQLSNFAKQYAALPMLARTHGQAATPTTLGKEFANVVKRLQRQQQQLAQAELLGKFNGAVGNFNAHHVAYPDINWLVVSEQFVNSLGLSWNAYTTQIEPHDSIAEFCQCLCRINTILIDLSRDCWGYIALNYLQQKPVANEVGSSTMPHKINPIDFENAEGNLSLASVILDHLSHRLPISRWQRDLVDSTLLRNLGVGLSYSYIAYQSLSKGLDKITANTHSIAADLDRHWEVLAEAIQTIMRRYGISQPYEKLKEFTRGSNKKINRQTLHAFIEQLELPSSVKQQLKELTPASYLGYAEKLALAIENGED
jgi:adenylosuccinate lyase